MTGKHEGNLFLDTPDDWIRLAEAVRADGCLSGGSIRFNLKKRRKIDRLVSLCQTTNSPYSIAFEPDRTRISLLECPLHFWIEGIFSKGKILGSWVLGLTAGQKKVWVEEAKHWDGCDKHAGTSWSFCTGDKQTAEWFQIMAHTCGYRFVPGESDNSACFGGRYSESIRYHGCVRKTTRGKLVESPNTVPYAGSVYCLTVPTGAFMVRRNGVVWITGNCHLAETMRCPPYRGSQL